MDKLLQVVNVVFWRKQGGDFRRKIAENRPQRNGEAGINSEERQCAEL
jgi:hypothetical protein